MTTKASVQNALPLRDLFLARKNDNFIADLVAPTIFVTKAKGHYYRLKNYNLIPENDILGSRSGAPEVFTDYEKQEYTVHQHGEKAYLDYQLFDYSDFESIERMRKDLLFTIKEKLMLSRELALAKLLTTPANFPSMTTALTGTQRWDDPSSDPTNQIKLAVEEIKLKGGKMPNTLILGSKVNTALSFNTALADRVSMTNEKVVSKAILSKLLMNAGIEIPENRIIVGNATYKTDINSADTYVWNDIALFAYIDPNASTMLDDTLVKNFRLKGNAGVKVGMYKSNDPTVLGEWITGQLDYGFELVNYKMGYLFTTVVS